MVDALAELEGSADVQERCYYGVAKAQILLAEGDHAGALDVAESVFSERNSLGVAHEPIKEAFVVAMLAALELDRLDKAGELIAIVDQIAPGLRPQFLNAQVARFRAHLAARAGKADETEHLFKTAGGLFHELAIPFQLAATRVEHSEWLAAHGRMEEAQPLLSEARAIFERLEAKPWLERLGQTSTVAREAEAVTAMSVPP
jgi:tetratricopeptide (TPR) repeat protein